MIVLLCGLVFYNIIVILYDNLMYLQLVLKRYYHLLPRRICCFKYRVDDAKKQKRLSKKAKRQLPSQSIDKPADLDLAPKTEQEPVILDKNVEIDVANFIPQGTLQLDSQLKMDSDEREIYCEIEIKPHETKLYRRNVLLNPDPTNQDVDKAISGLQQLKSSSQPGPSDSGSEFYSSQSESAANQNGAGERESSESSSGSGIDSSVSASDKKKEDESIRKLFDKMKRESSQSS